MLGSFFILPSIYDQLVSTASEKPASLCTFISTFFHFLLLLSLAIILLFTRTGPPGNIEFFSVSPVIRFIFIIYNSPLLSFRLLLLLGLFLPHFMSTISLLMQVAGSSSSIIASHSLVKLQASAAKRSGESGKSDLENVTSSCNLNIKRQESVDLPDDQFHRSLKAICVKGNNRPTRDIFLASFTLTRQ